MYHCVIIIFISFHANFSYKLDIPYLVSIEVVQKLDEHIEIQIPIVTC